MFSTTRYETRRKHRGPLSGSPHRATCELEHEVPQGRELLHAGLQHRRLTHQQTHRWRHCLVGVVLHLAVAVFDDAHRVHDGGQLSLERPQFHVGADPLSPPTRSSAAMFSQKRSSILLCIELWHSSY